MVAWAKAKLLTEDAVLVSLCPGIHSHIILCLCV